MNMPPRWMIQYFQELEPNAHLYLPGDGVDTEKVFYKGNNARGGNDDMAVKYVQDGGGGGLGSFLGPLSIVSSLIPGMQPVVAGLGAVNSLAKGNVGGAVMNGAKALSGAGAAGAKDAIPTPQPAGAGSLGDVSGGPSPYEMARLFSMWRGGSL